MASEGVIQQNVRCFSFFLSPDASQRQTAFLSFSTDLVAYTVRSQAPMHPYAYGEGAKIDQSSRGKDVLDLLDWDPRKPRQKA